MSLTNSSLTPSIPREVRSLDRAFDVTAALLIATGATLFFIAKRTFGAIAVGSYRMQEGLTHVAQTEMVDARSRFGAILIGVGLAVAAASAMRHFLHQRRSTVRD